MICSWNLFVPARVFAAAVLLLLAGCEGQDADAPTAAPARARNIVLITLDTTRADALGAYGQLRPTSPHIDRMATEGVRFDQVATASPSTLPSHATILTGKLPHAHGARSNAGYLLLPENETLAEILKRHGYATAAEIAAPVIGRHTLLDQGFDVYRDTLSTDVGHKTIRIRRDGSIDTVRLAEREAPDITQRGIEFLSAQRAEPFFLWLHYFDPHRLYRPPREFRQRFPGAPYHAEVAAVDAQVGRLLDTLRNLGLDRSTVVVLTADHGESLDEHDEPNHSFYVYDSTMRVPLIFWGHPSVAGGRVIDSLVRTSDIAPTLLDLLGLPPLRSAQGVSLVPLLTGEADDLDLTAYGESIELLAFGTAPIRFVREGRWKYIHKVDPELYDVVADPAELRNAASEQPQLVARLRGRMAEILAGSPAAPDGAARALDAGTREQLRALGYVTAGLSEGQAEQIASLTLSGADPASVVPDLRVFALALGEVERKQYGPAAEKFRRLWDEYRHGLFGLQLAENLVKLGRLEETAALLDAVADRVPESPEYLVRLADVLRRTGREREAAERIAAALAIDRCFPSARILDAHLAFTQGRYADQLASLRVAVDECPQSVDALNNFAYALATCPDPGLRDGRLAVDHATRAVGDAPEPDVNYLDTLAAAHAEAGDFEAAIRIQRRALASENSTASPLEMAVFRRHLALYEAGEALRDPE